MSKEFKSTECVFRNKLTSHEYIMNVSDKICPLKIANNFNAEFLGYLEK